MSRGYGLCDRCFKRPGEVVVDDLLPANHRMGIAEPWRFVFRMCRWCRAVETKRGWHFAPLDAS